MVAWLAALHAAGQLQRARQLTRDVMAWATCGHELGHLGLQELIHRHRPLITDAHYWLHLGANLGGAGTLTLRVRAVDAGEAQRMRDLLVAEGYPAQHIRVEPGSTISGEGHDLRQLGAKVLSLAGSNRHFHAASDRCPANVNAPGIASIARAVARWITLPGGLSPQGRCSRWHHFRSIAQTLSRVTSSGVVASLCSVPGLIAGQGPRVSAASLRS